MDAGGWRAQTLSRSALAPERDLLIGTDFDDALAGFAGPGCGFPVQLPPILRYSGHLSPLFLACLGH